jgi:signal transduction histidine kinase
VVEVATGTGSGTDGYPTASVTVSNPGDHLDDAELERIVRPFERATIARNGSGLGLAIVSAIATSHRGHLTISSPSTGGLTATFSLPAARAEGGSP